MDRTLAEHMKAGLYNPQEVLAIGECTTGHVHYLQRTCCPLQNSMQGVTHGQSCRDLWCGRLQMKQPQLVNDRQLVGEEGDHVLLEQRFHVSWELLQQQQQAGHVPEGVLASVKLLLKLAHVQIEQLCSHAQQQSTLTCMGCTTYCIDKYLLQLFSGN